MTSNPNRYKRQIEWLINGENKTAASRDLLGKYYLHNSLA